MQNDVSEIVGELEKIEAEVRQEFGSLTAQQINWRPSPDGWSIGQCLDHLIKSNEGFYAEFDKLAAGTRKNSFWEKFSPLSSFAGSFLVKSLKADDKRVKTIPSMTPPSDIDAGIVETFARHQAELTAKVKAIANADWQKTVVTSPFFGLMTYKLDDGMQAIVEHEKRHVRQAKRVLESGSFPKQIFENMAESLRSRLFRWRFNLFPAYRASGGRVAYTAEDFREMRVKIPLSRRTRNYVGTIYGGSMYSAVDPIYMLMLIRILGPGYTVWDKATIAFRKPGKETLYVDFKLSDEEIDQIKRLADTRRSVDRVYMLELKNGEGVTHASVEKTLYIAKKGK